VANSGPTYATLRADLRKETIAPVYVLFGEEDYLVDEAVDAIIAAAIGTGDRGFNLDVVYGGDTDGRDIVARASSFPMMAGRRVVVVRDADRMSARDTEILSAYVERPSPTTCLVLVGEKPDFRKKPFSFVRKAGAAIEFRHLFENQIPAWVTDHVARGGRRIDAEAAKLLAASTGTSLRGVTNELDKLAVYLGERKVIGEDDVCAVVGVSKEFTVFELQKAIGLHQTARAVTILSHMIEERKQVPVVIASLTTYFTTLWKLYEIRRQGVSVGEKTAAARIHPYFIAQNAQALETTSVPEIERAILHLARADQLTKSVSGDPMQVMLTLIVLLCGGEGGDSGKPGWNFTADEGV